MQYMSPNGIQKQESGQNVNKLTKYAIRITAFWSNSNSEQQSKSSLEGSVWIQNGIQNQELDQKWEKLMEVISKILAFCSN